MNLSDVALVKKIAITGINTSLNRSCWDCEHCPISVLKFKEYNGQCKDDEGAKKKALAWLRIYQGHITMLKDLLV
jgi:hypothetical protein